MTELKTLKDLLFVNNKNPLARTIEGVIRYEAIKWVKEDLNAIKRNPLLNIEERIANQFVERWMKRLNITEEDLK